MKKILVILAFFLISENATSQQFPINDKTGKVSFENIVKVDSVSKSDLYIRASEWFAKKFNSANSVIQMQDKDAGKIIGKGNITAYGHYGSYESGIWKFTISFASKEGRFRYAITDIYHEKGGADISCNAGGDIENDKPACGIWGMTKKQWNKIKSNAFSEFDSIAKDFESSMKVQYNDDDDW